MCINWSNRNLGKFALTKIKKKVIPIDLIAKIKTHPVEFIAVLNNVPVNCFVTKQLPPPKKKITHKLDISKILAYSPKKKAANIIAEYSTL